jgi:sec-independent protein translocase protein TatA
MHIPFLDQWGIILIIGLLLFGKRLPEVGRSIGKGIVEFKKGLAGIEDDVTQAGTNTPPAQPARPVLTQQTTAAPPAYKFDPNTGKPLQPEITNAIPAGARFDPYTGKPLNNETVSVGTDSTSSSSQA